MPSIPPLCCQRRPLACHHECRSVHFSTAQKDEGVLREVLRRDAEEAHKIKKRMLGTSNVELLTSISLFPHCFYLLRLSLAFHVFPSCSLKLSLPFYITPIIVTMVLSCETVVDSYAICSATYVHGQAIPRAVAAQPSCSLQPCRLIYPACCLAIYEYPFSALYAQPDAGLDACQSDRSPMSLAAAARVRHIQRHRIRAAGGCRG